jgi:hypothetical protein
MGAAQRYLDKRSEWAESEAEARICEELEGREDPEVERGGWSAGN